MNLAKVTYKRDTRRFRLSNKDVGFDEIVDLVCESYKLKRENVKLWYEDEEKDHCTLDQHTFSDAVLLATLAPPTSCGSMLRIYAENDVDKNALDKHQEVLNISVEGVRQPTESSIGRLQAEINELKRQNEELKSTVSMCENETASYKMQIQECREKEKAQTEELRRLNLLVQNCGQRKCHGNHNKERQCLMLLQCMHNSGRLSHEMFASIASIYLANLKIRPEKLRRFNHIELKLEPLLRNLQMESWNFAPATQKLYEAVTTALQGSLNAESIQPILKEMQNIPSDIQLLILMNVAFEVIPQLRSIFPNFFKDPESTNPVYIIPKHFEHDNVSCDKCGCAPIIGPRFQCTICVDFDLCGTCYAIKCEHHDPSHVFHTYLEKKQLSHFEITGAGYPFIFHTQPIPQTVPTHTPFVQPVNKPETENNTETKHMPHWTETKENKSFQNLKETLADGPKLLKNAATFAASMSLNLTKCGLETAACGIEKAACGIERAASEIEHASSHIKEKVENAFKSSKEKEESEEVPCLGTDAEISETERFIKEKMDAVFGKPDEVLDDKSESEEVTCTDKNTDMVDVDPIDTKVEVDGSIETDEDENEESYCMISSVTHLKNNTSAECADACSSNCPSALVENISQEDNCSSNPAEDTSIDARNYIQAMETLVDMGFCNVEANNALLKQFKGNVRQVIQHLCEL